jgi:hypothetical protein
MYDYDRRATPKPVKVFEHEGVRASIFNSDKGGYNVMCHDIDSGENIGGRIGVKDLKEAEVVAKRYIGLLPPIGKTHLNLG